MNKDHEKIKELISSYIDGAVSDSERREVEDLILNEKEWQEYYKELQKLSGTLQEWRDEEVSADMASEIQKTLLDEKLREGATMKGDTWFKVGGGALVTFALCMIIGIVYLRTYSKEARQDYFSGKQIYEPQTYEPYYAEQPRKAAPDNFREDRARDKSDVDYKKTAVISKAGPAVSSKLALEEGEYDLAASYKESGQKDAPTVQAPSLKGGEMPAQESFAKQEQKQKRRQQGGFQMSSYDTNYGIIRGIGDDGSRRLESERQALGTSSDSTRTVDRLSSVTQDAGALMADEAYGNREYARSVEKNKAMTRNGMIAQGGIAGGRVANEPAAVVTESIQRKEYFYQPTAPARQPSEEAVDYRRRNIRYPGYDYDDADGGELYYPYPQPDPRRYPDPYYQPEPDTEEYAPIYENPFLTAASSPLSTFSIDVDTASYSNVRRFLDRGQLPPADAVRIEEMVNYFDYDYPKPTRGEPFSVTTRGAVCPWNSRHILVQIGLKGNVPAQRKIPPSNLVFLIDVSGSMNRANKLPLLKQSLKLMVDQLRPDQHVAIVTYSGSARLVLDSTSGAYKHRIHAAIDNLTAGGSTAGEAGLRLAYRIAKDNYIRNGNNRVILATDGDFNVGMQNDYELTQFIQSKRQDGVFLSILGFGSGNYKDAKMEKIADNGNGNYYYIDSLQEGKKVLVSELGSTLFTIAKDVKIQVEFNPSQVHAYRLIGYENRLLNNRDFNNDRIDAGEVGAGHTVTALYEVVPAGGPVPMPHEERGVDRLKYQKPAFWANQDLMTVKLRYKPVKSNRSRLIRGTVKRSDVSGYMDEDLAFASAVAEFGLLLRNSRFKGHASYDRVLERASRARGADLQGHRAEFIRLVEQAKRLDHRTHYPRYPYPEPYPQYQTGFPQQQSPVQFK